MMQGILTSQSANSNSSTATNRLKTANKRLLLSSSNSVTFDTAFVWSAAIWDDAASEGSGPAVALPSKSGNVVGPNASSIGQAGAGVIISTRTVPISLKDTYANARAIVQTIKYYPLDNRCGEVRVSAKIAPNPVGTPTMNLVIRSSVLGAPNDTKIPQSDWNIDTFSDAFGVEKNPSQIKLDFQLFQSMIIENDMVMGRLRIGFIVNGELKYAHEITSTNNPDYNLPIFQSFNLPVRVEVANVSAQAHARMGFFDDANGVYLEAIDNFVGGTSQISFKDASVSLEDSEQFVYNPSPVFGPFNVALTPSFIPIISIRPKLTFNSISNRTILVPNEITVTIRNNNPAEVAVYVGGVISNDMNWTDPGADYSYQVNINGGTLTGGIPVKGTAIRASGGSTNTLVFTAVDYILPVSLSKVDDYVIEQPPLTLMVKETDGNTFLENAVINIGEVYN